MLIKFWLRNMQKLSTYFNTPQKCLTALTGLFVFMLPLSRAIPTILLIPLLLALFFNYRSLILKKFIPVLLLLAAAVWLLIIALINHSFGQDRSIFSRFLLLFFIFFTCSQVPLKKRLFIEYAFLSGMLIAIIGSSINIGIELYHNPSFMLANGGLINQILWLERPYFGFMMTLSLFICLKNAENRKQHKFYILAILFYAFTLYISARLATGLSTLLILLFLLKNTRIKGKYKLWGGVIFMALLFIGIGFNNSFTARLKLGDNLTQSIKKFEDYEPRFVIWPCSYHIITHKMNLFTGLKSSEKVEHELVSCYQHSITKKSKRTYYLHEKFNSHNQFIGFFLLGGIFPFLLLVSVFLWGWFFTNISYQTKIILLLFFVFFMVENVLARQLGCYLFGTFVALYLKPAWQK